MPESCRRARRAGWIGSPRAPPPPRAPPGRASPRPAETFAGLQFLDEWRQPAMLVAMNGAVLRANRSLGRLVLHTTLVRMRDGMLELSDDQHRRILDDCHADLVALEAGSAVRATDNAAAPYRM